MNAIYEEPSLLAEYLLFHYATDEEILDIDRADRSNMRESLGFPVRTTQHFSEGSCQRALDLGCAVGRSTFEMSKNCQEVIGIDYSRAFIEAANEMKNTQEISYQRHDEGHCFTQLKALLPQGIDPAKATFEVGDAQNLRSDLGEFDRVHAANLLCRLGEPKKLLDRFPDLVRSEGELLLATPGTWLKEFTAPENWPKQKTFDWLESELAPSFILLKVTEEPFLIRETCRKFQWSYSIVSKWKRR